MPGGCHSCASTCGENGIWGRGPHKPTETLQATGAAPCHRVLGPAMSLPLLVPALHPPPAPPSAPGQPRLTPAAVCSFPVRVIQSQGDIPSTSPESWWLLSPHAQGGMSPGCGTAGPGKAAPRRASPCPSPAPASRDPWSSPGMPRQGCGQQIPTGRVPEAQGWLGRGGCPGDPPGHPHTAQAGDPRSQRLQALPPAPGWRSVLPGGPAQIHGHLWPQVQASPCGEQGLILPRTSSFPGDMPSRLLLAQQGLHHPLPKAGSKVLGADGAGAAAVAWAGLGARELSPGMLLFPWDRAVTLGTPGTTSCQLCGGQQSHEPTPVGRSHPILLDLNHLGGAGNSCSYQGALGVHQSTNTEPTPPCSVRSSTAYSRKSHNIILIFLLNQGNF